MSERKAKQKNKKNKKDNAKLKASTLTVRSNMAMSKEFSTSVSTKATSNQAVD